MDREKIQLIDNAIDSILNNLANGIEISEWEIDGVRFKKRSPLELIDELKKIKVSITKKSLPNRVQYVFKD